MTKKEIDKLAAEIAKDLFTIGGVPGWEADHLRLYSRGRYLGGWALEPARDRIASHLQAALALAAASPKKKQSVK